MLFSQRIGLKPAGKLVQREALDEDIRNKIWNVLKLQLWDHWEPVPDAYDMRSRSHEALQIEQMLQYMWFHYFKKPLDVQPKFHEAYRGKSYYDLLREIFLARDWHEVFDLLETIIQCMPREWRSKTIDFLNLALKEENSAYRILDMHVVEITDENETSEVSIAIEKSTNSVKLHLRRSLELLTDRKSPDYRNSIKESISAVEAICREITQQPGATLSQCLGVIKKKHKIHTAFEQALTKLYGFTSDSGGIRHALTEDSEEPTYADAKFMLVSCSAFTNYLRTLQIE